MSGNLFFICPTDHLELAIDQAFGADNYYLTSLGNSMTFDAQLICRVRELLEKKAVSRIYFVLSDDNRIISDAIHNQELHEVSGLERLYGEISRQQFSMEELWESCNSRHMLLSYHLNDKIKELKRALKLTDMELPPMDGKVYIRNQSIFSPVYPELLCREYISLN